MKQKLLNFIKNNILIIILSINILYLFIGSYLFTVETITYEKFGRSIITAFNINFIVVTLLLVTRIFITKKYKFKIYDLFYILITVFALISTHYAISKDAALYGSIYRYEGLYAILYYLELSFLASFVSKEKKKIVVGLIILIGIFQAIYGYFQMLNVPFVHKYIHDRTVWRSGTLNNPNFYASFMLITVGYIIGLFIDSKEYLVKALFAVVTVILTAGLLISNTTSCAVGLIVILIYLFIYCIIKKKLKCFSIILLIIVCETLLLSKFNMTTIVNDIIKTKNETVELAKGNYNKNYGTKRVEVWKTTLKIVPHYYLHGAGIDNFYYAFGRMPLIVGNQIFDKAHNEYLQTLVTQGIFSLISYLALYGIVTLRGIRDAFKKKETYLLLPVIGYMVQAFFNISVIEVAPFFFIALGLLIDREEKYFEYKKFFKRFLDILISLILFIILLPVNILISILILVIDHTNPIYKQKRTGKNGKNFTMFKFRTMKDDKVTNLGSILRKISIDELPQLINVLIGNMSLIGPRPWIPEYYEKFNDEQKQRVLVRPGIIGLAQVNGRNSIDIFKKIEYDIKYIEDITFINDLKIVFKSFKVLIAKEDVKTIDDNIKKELKDLSKNNTKKKGK